MLKHILEKHGEEEVENVDFGARVLRFARSAFDRQVIESVLIQEEREHHNILNSKSEYNRCSLPRLTAKLGENEWKKKLKEGEDEKEKEKRLERRILEMRKERNSNRKGEPTEVEQPPTKKRKTGEKEWKVVRQMGNEATKRKEEGENEESEHPSKRRKKDIRYYMKKDNEGVGEDNNTTEEESSGESRGEDKEEEENSNDHDHDPEQETVATEGVSWGSWENREWMDADFWDEYIEERTKRLQVEEKERRERKEKAEREEKSWELARVTRSLIEECKTNNWIRNKEMRKEKEKLEKGKRERLEKVKRKKDEIEKKRKQQTLMEMIKKIPHREREIIEMEERKFKKLELQEMKQNLWRKWRGRRKEEKRDTGEDSIERQTTEIEKILEKLEEDKN